MTRFKHKREYYIPENAQPVECGGTDGIVYVYTEKNNLYALAFHGKAQKPDWHFRFLNQESLAKRIADFIAARRGHAAMRAEHTAKREAPSTLKVGDVLNTCWGYDQTNREFFQVTALAGEKMVELREIAQTVEETAWCQGTCKPKKDEFIGQPIRRRVKYGDHVQIDKVRGASLWHGNAVSWSSYA